MNFVSAARDLVFRAQAFSFDITPPSGIPTETSDLANTIKTVIATAYSIAGVATVGWLIYGGYKWIIATGDPQEMSAAQKTLLNAVIGLVIIVSTAAIFNFVSEKLGVGGLFDVLNLPTM
ncbi:MAG: pilin [Patescibacteria group bacterium]|nr:pilin [Patescibacteria group bacterium]